MAEIVRIFDPQPSGESGPQLNRLEDAARVAASWDVVRQPSSKGSFSRRIDVASHGLERLERFLAARNDPRSAKGPQLEPTASSLRELRTHLRSLRGSLSAITGAQQVIEQLPHILLTSGREDPRIAGVAHIYLGAVDGVFDPASFCAFLRMLQTREPLTLDELSNVVTFLQFALLEFLLRDVRAWLCSPKSESSLNLLAYFNSLTAVRRAAWPDLLEPLIVFDDLLRQDPAGAYEHMDPPSRGLYRQRVAFLARRSDCSEVAVAQAALELARLASQRTSADPRMQVRRAHVGYYLIDKGFPSLASRINFHPSPGGRVRQSIRRTCRGYLHRRHSNPILCIRGACALPGVAPFLIPSSPDPRTFGVAAARNAMRR